jgi:hypothetical protein
MTPELRSRLLHVAADLSAFLTVLAAIPYELGEAAMYLTPEAKSWIAGIGVFSTLGLRILNRFLEPKTK